MFGAPDGELGLVMYYQIIFSDISQQEFHFLVPKLGKGKGIIRFLK